MSSLPLGLSDYASVHDTACRYAPLSASLSLTSVLDRTSAPAQSPEMDRKRVVLVEEGKMEPAGGANTNTHTITQGGT